MAEPLRMSLGWAVHMGEGKWPAREEVWVGEGIHPGFKERLLLNCFSSDLSFKIWFELNLNEV
jgi:hypothetical protein